LKTNFTKGLLKGFAYYAIGFVIASLTYLLFGWNYKHAPGLHHIVAFLFLLGGAGWILYYFFLIFSGQNSKVNFAVFAVHLVVILAVILYFVIDIRSEDVTQYKTDPADIITIKKDTATKISSIVNGNGDTLYAVKGDSVLIDKIGSDTIKYP
jgi:divalent metal cation (Fe/Co/Zn/Cd) transporter